MNKKGAIIYNLYLIFIVLFLCAISLLNYNNQIKELTTSITDPTPILKTYDDITLYNLYEEETITNIMKREEETNNIREEYITRLLNNNKALTQLMNNTELEGQTINKEEYEDYLRNVIYPTTAFNKEEEQLIIKRGTITKHQYLKRRIGKNYPVDFYWENKETRTITIPTKEEET